MPKSPKASRKPTRKPRTFGQGIVAAERKRKPNKKLRELMQHKPVWEHPTEPIYFHIIETFQKMMQVNEAAGKKAAYVVLAQFGVKSVRDLKPWLYPEVLAAADRALANLKQTAGPFQAAKVDDTAILSNAFVSDATCAWCEARPGQPHLRTCKSIVVGAATAAQAENAKLVEQPGTKPSNPKDALGILKCPASTIPGPVMSEVGVAMLEGALKYGRHNYRAIGVRASVYYDAVVERHMKRWWEGEDIDAMSDLHHVTKAIAGLCVLRDAIMQGKFVDDRPPKSPAGWQDELDKKVKALIEKYPNPVPPYVEGDERMK